MYKLSCLLIAMFIVFAVVLLFLTGCSSAYLHEPTALDALIDATTALTFAASASAPINPYGFPLSIGLAGLTAVLEALRRKEKSGRKHAEQKLNGNNNNH